MDAGTSFSLKAQSRCPLQEQYMQRKNARENVISYIFLIIASNSFTISFNSLQNLNRVLRDYSFFFFFWFYVFNFELGYLQFDL